MSINAGPVFFIFLLMIEHLVRGYSIIRTNGTSFFSEPSTQSSRSLQVQSNIAQRQHLTRKQYSGASPPPKQMPTISKLPAGKSATMVSFPMKSVINQCQQYSDSLQVQEDQIATFSIMYPFSQNILLYHNCFQSLINPVDDFCTFACPLFRKTEDSSITLYHEIATTMKEIAVSSIEDIWKDPTFSIALVNSYLAENTTYEYTSWEGSSSKLHRFRLDSSTDLLQLLPEIARKHPVIILDFGNDLVCQRAIAELFFFARRHVVFGFNAWQSVQRQPPRQKPGYNDPITFSDMEIRYISSTLSTNILHDGILSNIHKQRENLLKIAEYGYLYANNHLSVPTRCKNLLYTIKLGTESKIPVNMKKPSNSADTTLPALPPSSVSSSTDKPNDFIVVVSHFKEEYQHLLFLKNLEIPHAIINRGDASDKVSGLNIVYDEKNEGRENAVYLKYIIEHYDSLPRVIVFTQSEAKSNFDHTFKQEIHEKTIHSLYTIAQSKQERERIFGKSNIIQSSSRVRTNFNSSRSEALIDQDGFYFLGHIAMYAMVGVSEIEKLTKLFPKFIDEVLSLGEDKDSSVFSPILSTSSTKKEQNVVLNRWFGPGATMVVTRDLIRRRSKASYQRLLALLLDDVASLNNPPIGHFYERFWPAIFNSHCTKAAFYACFYHRHNDLWTDRFRDPPLLTFS